ncbi:MAG: MMPL family transporter, partial [Candidatus Omnitrophota bacterium]|nr:MMPL family transporter [Candidatus Omnitrophota bacterium]
NWQHIEDSDPKSAVNKAVRWTFHASFWCMVTTLLGFLSLLLVPAKPLRELGISGALGTLVAIMSAYGVYPSFLRLVSTQNHQKPGLQRSGFGPSSFALFNRYEKIFVFLLIGLCVISVPGLRKIKTDPSLLSYFSPKSEIHQGLLYIDRNGGSSPAIIVLRASNGEKLNSSRAYQQLWDLQTDLERHPAVGTIVSLPVIMAEAKRAPFAFFLSWEWLLNILEQPNFGRIANSFVTQDRQYGLFLLRMKETGRKTSRLDVVEELKDIVSLHGFVPELSGGVYILQGRLAQLVASSLVYGLGNLLLIFTVIGLIISRSIKLTLAITASVGAIALSILGTMGNLKIPFDVIAAPAANIAIGMGIDSMIHSVMNFRRFRKESQNNTAAWLKTRQHLWKAILGSMLIIAMGFGIFCFSTFPPTQRFGAAVVYGTVIAALTAIFFMPFLTNLGLRKK